MLVTTFQTPVAILLLHLGIKRLEAGRQNDSPYLDFFFLGA